MATDFPNNPAVNDVFTSGNKSWKWDGNVWRATAVSAAPLAPLTREQYYSYVEDWDDLNAGFADPWYSTVSGSASIALIDSETKHPGIIRLSTTAPSASAGYYAIFSMSGSINSPKNRFFLDPTVPLVQRWVVRAPTLPTEAENYVVNMGLQDINNLTRGVRCGLAWSSGSARWTLSTTTGGSTTDTPSSVSYPLANTWHIVELHATTASVSLYVDGVFQGSTTSTIPTAGMTLFAIMVKYGTVNTRTFDIDAVQVTQEF